MRPDPVRAVGALTAAYGIGALLRPSTLARHADLGDPADPPPAVRVLSSTIGVRDLLSGLTLIAARGSRARRVAVGARVAFDLGDAVVFGTQLPTPRARRTLAVIAGAWAATGLGALLAAERRR